MISGARARAAHAAQTSIVLAEKIGKQPDSAVAVSKVRSVSGIQIGLHGKSLRQRTTPALLRAAPGAASA